MLFVLTLLILEINNFASWARMLHCTRQYSGRIRPPRGGGKKQLSWEVGKKTALGPKKICPKKSKNLDIFLFPSPNSGKFCPILAISHNWGRKNPKFLALRAIFGQYLTLLPRAPRKIREENRFSRYRGLGKKQDLWPEY